MLHFLILSILTNLIFSYIIFTFLVYLDKRKVYSNKEIFIYSLGLGPVFTTLILYYLFLIFPNYSYYFYALIIIINYFILGLISYKQNVLNFIKFKIIVFDTKKSNIISFLKSNILIIISIIFFLSFLFTVILKKPLIGHDILNYAVIGDMIFEAKSLEPIWIRNYSSGGYIYRHSLPPSFSLLIVWEKIINNFFYLKSDYYFRSISAYYGALIVGIQYYWVSKQNKWLAIITSIALFSSFSFLIFFLRKHLDSYRIYLYILSFIFLINSIKNEDNVSLIFFGIFSGFASYAHRIGLVLALINYITFILLVNFTLKKRISKIIILLNLLFLFGGSHYIFDLIFGRGIWIYK